MSSLYKQLVLLAVSVNRVIYIPVSDAPPPWQPPVQIRYMITEAVVNTSEPARYQLALGP